MIGKAFSGFNQEMGQSTVFFTGPLIRKIAAHKSSRFDGIIQFRRTGALHLFAQAFRQRCQIANGFKIVQSFFFPFFIQSEVDIKGVFNTLNVDKGMLDFVRQAEKYGEYLQLILIRNTIVIHIPGGKIVELRESAARIHGAESISNGFPTCPHFRIACNFVHEIAGLCISSTSQKA